MEIIDLTKTLPVKGSNGRRSLAELVHAVVHHEGVVSDGKDVVKRLVGDANYHIGKGWNRIAYHFCVALDGKVYALNPLEEIAYHSGNPKLHKVSFGVVLEGDLSKQRPPASQVAALWTLLDHLTTGRPDLPGVVRATVKTHLEVRPQPTSCPSPIIHRLVEAYRTAPL